MKKKKYKIVKTLEEWAKIEAYGNWESHFRNGELYSFNNEFYYLSHLELDPDVLHELIKYHEVTRL